MPALPLNPVEFQLLCALLDAQVRFVVVGGFAVCFHGHLREVKDLDILSEPSQENAARLAMALQQVGLSIDREQEVALARPGVQTRLRGKFANIEILTSINAVEFGEAFEQAAHHIEKGREVRVLSRDHVIKTKLSRGEAKDMEDVRALKARAS